METYTKIDFDRIADIYGTEIDGAFICNVCGVEIKTTDVEDFEDLITIAITNEPMIYHYCNKATVNYAITEAGADQNILNKVKEKLKASPLVPNDLNYGE